MRLPSSHLLAVAAAGLALAGCDLLEGDCQVDGDLETCTYSLVSDGDGVAGISFDVDSDETAVQVTGVTAQYIAVERVFDDRGDVVLTWGDWYDSAESLTGAIWLEGKDSVLNWPIREEDPQLDSGTWRVEFGVVDYDEFYLPDEPVDVTVKLKRDDDFQDGKVKVRVVYCAGLSNDSVVTQGVEDALARWDEIWAPYGLQLEASFADSDFDPDLAFPGYDPEHMDIAEEADGSEITILVGETIDGSTDYLGVAGSIPGTLTATSRAVVVVSWLANAGTDGAFDTEDIRLFGETLAHETGHYMGLFHPVEMDWSYWDALSDTPSCSNTTTCESELGPNLMFPYPVCSGASCLAQDDLTDDQQGVSHRYTGTL